MDDVRLPDLVGRYALAGIQRTLAARLRHDSFHSNSPVDAVKGPRPGIRDHAQQEASMSLRPAFRASPSSGAGSHASKAGRDRWIPPFWHQRMHLWHPNPTRSVVSAACMLRRPRSRSGSCVAVPACPNVAMSGTQEAPPTFRAGAVLSVGIVKHNAESSPAACRAAGQPHETHSQIHDRKELHNVITAGRALGRPQT